MTTTERIAALLPTGGDLDEMLENAALADSHGYEAINVTHIATRDSFSCIARLSGHVQHAALGTAVAPIYHRSPASMAQAAATVAEMTGGRFRLGLGTGHQVTMGGWHGQTIGKPVAEMREYVVRHSRRARRHHPFRRLAMEHHLRLRGLGTDRRGPDSPGRALARDAEARRRDRRRGAPVGLPVLVRPRRRRAGRRRGAARASARPWTGSRSRQPSPRASTTRAVPHRLGSAPSSTGTSAFLTTEGCSNGLATARTSPGTTQRPTPTASSRRSATSFSPISPRSATRCDLAASIQRYRDAGANLPMITHVRGTVFDKAIAAAAPRAH